MTDREQRGLEIAARLRLTQYGDQWSVPSQSNGSVYAVRFNGDVATCTCPDFEGRALRCKHIWAVHYTIERERPDVQLTPELPPVPALSIAGGPKPKRTTYPQQWPAYHRAQRNEQREFMRLLFDLCQTIEQPDYKFGRPRLPLADMVYSTALKVYSTKSGRRFMGDLDTALERGYLSQVPHHSSLFRSLESAELTPIIQKLIAHSAAPLALVETRFGPDSSGFSTSRFARWYDEKYGRERSKQIWVKAHIMVGVKTNIITAAAITDRDANDYPQLPGLLETTAKQFKVKEVPADKAYLGQSNLEAIIKAGAEPYIPFKSNSVPGASQLWDRLYGFFMFNRADFLTHYHTRSNVETAFSMIKAKFGDALRCKTDDGLANEALLKVLCHNICVVIQEAYELGVDPSFEANEPAPVSKVLRLSQK